MVLEQNITSQAKKSLKVSQIKNKYWSKSVIWSLPGAGQGDLNIVMRWFEYWFALLGWKSLDKLKKQGKIAKKTATERLRDCGNKVA